MREPVRDRQRLVHILEAIGRLQEHAGSLTKEELETHVARYLSETDWEAWERGEKGGRLKN